MAEIDGEQYAARKLGCEISADPLNPLDPIKKVCKSHHPDEDLSILDRAYRRAVIQHSAQRRKSGRLPPRSGPCPDPRESGKRPAGG